MNRNLLFIAALGAGSISGSGLAQAPAAPAAAAPAPAAPAAAAPVPAGPAAAPAAPMSPAPQAVPAKIALVAFEQAVFATNEGQRSVQDVQKKFAPKKTELETMQNEIDALKKQLDGASATLTAENRTARLKAIDSKEKAMTRAGEDAQTAYNAELQDTYGKLAQKFSAVLKDYVAKNGYTLLLDVSSQSSAVMWATTDVNTDVTEAVVQAYNAASGIAAPAAGGPAANRPRPAGAGTAPKPVAKPAAPK